MFNFYSFYIVVAFKAGNWIVYKESHSQKMCVGRITGIVVTDETTPDHWLRVQLTRKFNELPGTMKSKERYQNSQNNNEIWLEEIRTTIRIQDVVRHTTVWIKNNSVDTSTPLIFEFSIQEIIYNFNGCQKL